MLRRERGYLIPAIGDVYLDCARRLKDSILSWHPGADITILTEDFLPYGNQGGFANDWQVFEASPYRQTIKLEADMICASSIDHWWSLFEHRDVVISKGARDFYDHAAVSRRYRQIFDVNHLPDVYNAITYWRLSKTAQVFFDWVKKIFQHWSQFRTLLRFPEEHASTDVVYALAAQIMGPESVTLPGLVSPQIVHMKRTIIPIQGDDWTKELIWEHTDPGIRINTVAQWGMVHYHVKEWK